MAATHAVEPGRRVPRVAGCRVLGGGCGVVGGGESRRSTQGVRAAGLGGDRSVPSREEEPGADAVTPFERTRSQRAFQRAGIGIEVLRISTLRVSCPEAAAVGRR